jgi:ankyrin repeat protein
MTLAAYTFQSRQVDTLSQQVAALLNQPAPPEGIQRLRAALLRQSIRELLPGNLRVGHGLVAGLTDSPWWDLLVYEPSETASFETGELVVVAPQQVRAVVALWSSQTGPAAWESRFHTLSNQLEQLRKKVPYVFGGVMIQDDPLPSLRQTLGGLKQAAKKHLSRAIHQVALGNDHWIHLRGGKGSYAWEALDVKALAPAGGQELPNVPVTLLAGLVHYLQQGLSGPHLLEELGSATELGLTGRIHFEPQDAKAAEAITLPPLAPRTLSRFEPAQAEETGGPAPLSEPPISYPLKTADKQRPVPPTRTAPEPTIAPASPTNENAADAEEPADNLAEEIEVSPEPETESTAGPVRLDAGVKTRRAQRRERRQQRLKKPAPTRFPLHEAMNRKDEKALTAALEAGFDPDQKDEAGLTPLHLAAQEGALAMARLLLEGDADPNARNYAAATPLHTAAAAGFVPLIALLIEFGGEWQARNNRGHTPLHTAAISGCADCTQVLLQHQADYHSQMELGIQPLHLAAWYGHTEVIEALLKAGAKVSALNDDGNSALHFAAFNGQVRTIKQLINLQAPAHIENADGLSYLQCLNEGYQGSMIRIL